MNLRAPLAELLGTFALTLVVLVASTFNTSIATPVAAGLTLGLFVYTVGWLSGAHLNPAVTLAMLSVEKIKPRPALYYIVAQFLGAALAMVLMRSVIGKYAAIAASGTMSSGIGEAIGAAFLAFGVAAATFKKVDAAASGIVVGGSLLLGAYVASATELSHGVLNPAVAFGIGTFNLMYVLGPIVGAVAGAWMFKLLHDE